MKMFFDTETTGFPRNGLPADHPSQPHVVQLAAMLTEDDGTERAVMSMIIKPEGWTIPDEAAAIHGIDTATAERVGVPIKHAISGFMGMFRAASLLVAHNLDFDRRIIGYELARVGATWGGVETFCTMQAATPVLNLPPTDRMKAAGFHKPKAPKLGEAFLHFFGRELDGAHDALVDVRACRDVYFALQAHAERKLQEV